MAVALQSNRRGHSLFLEYPLRGLSIAYDGGERIGATRHQEALDESYKNGYNDASSQYNQQILEFRSEVNELREQTFAQLEQKFQTILGEAREALMTLTYECVKRTLGGYEMETEAVRHIVETIIDESGLDEEKLDVRMHPADIALLEDLEAELKAKHPGLNFLPDNMLKRGDCLLSSRFGKVDGLMSTKLEKLRGSLMPE